MACNNLQPLLVRPSWCDNWFQQNFSEKKNIQFSPSFLEVSCGIRSPLPASFHHFSAGYKEATGIDLSVSAYVARKGQERRAIEGLAGRPGPKRQDRPVFFGLRPGRRQWTFSEISLRKSWRSDMIQILDRKWWIDLLAKSPHCGVGKYFKLKKSSHSSKLKWFDGNLSSRHIFLLPYSLRQVNVPGSDSMRLYQDIPGHYWSWSRKNCWTLLGLLLLC